jgi:hypothetical protein
MAPLQVKKKLGKLLPTAVPTEKKKLKLTEPEEDDEESAVEEKAKKAKGDWEAKVLSSKSRVDEVDYEEIIDEETDEEENDEEENDEEEQEKTSKKTKNRDEPTRSRAEAFNNVTVAGTSNNVKTGKYEAIIRSVVLQEMDTRGQSVRYNFDLVDPEYEENNKLVTWSKLFRGDESVVDVAVKILKRQLVRLGYKEDEINFDLLPEIFEEITNENPGVILKISYNKGNDGIEYQRIEIDDVCESEMIDDYKDRVVF